MDEPSRYFPQILNDPRLNIDQVREQHLATARHTELLTVFDSIPNMALILNEARQVVYGNRPLLEGLGLVNFEEVLALRPGEVIGCLHSRGEGGCGHADACRYCGAVQVIMESQATRSVVSSEARVTVWHDGRPTSLDLNVTATPLNLEAFPLTMLYLVDISAKKRREYLEKVFIHDLLNTITGLSLMTQMLDLREASQNLQAEVGTIHEHINMMVEDIRGHSLLIKAEQGELSVSFSTLSIDSLIQVALRTIDSLATLSKVTIVYEAMPTMLAVVTDKKLARRVLVNALKNAIEASSAGATVGVNVIAEPSGEKTIAINNQQVIPEEGQHQIFQRSFSTKGAGRGVGTYSMRLLQESYLQGRVSFTSAVETGTTFFITFPGPGSAA